MSNPHVAPHGSWKSPITSDLIVSETIRLEEVALDGDEICWTEMRPREGGRNVLVRRGRDGRTHDVLPPPWNARSRVHEYGGGAFAVNAGVLVFVSCDDQRVYRVDPGGAPAAITPEGLRYADFAFDGRRERLICVREDHRGDVTNALAAVPLAGGSAGVVLAGGNDFYSSPCLSPDGSRLAWLTWNHPDMPWDGTELWVAEIAADGSLAGARKVAGGSEESIFQPAWSPAGVLHFVSDRTGWWNLYRLAGDKTEPLAARAAEFGVPQWVFGLSTYGFAEGGRILAAFNERGAWRLVLLHLDTGRAEPIDTPYTEVSDLKVEGRRAVFVGGSPAEPRCLVELDLAARSTRVLRRSAELALDPGYLSVPEAIEFPTEGGTTAHAFFYRPRNRDFAAPPGARPPLLVRSHGGPTSAASNALVPETQFWTSRGFAILDVNYGGSTGYGRSYRKRLEGAWGVVDVDDCVNGARHLARRGEVDPERLAIRGGSAGGYTTLAALTFRNIFRAGASHYGVSDLEALTGDTHKFESRYLDRLIGPYPERRDLYVARSPVHHADHLSCPVIFFQGLEDEVVPPAQAEAMVEALRRKGIPVAYLPFAGERHGFRRGENVKRALDAELYFYSRVFGFELADRVEPVAIANLT